MAGQKKTSPLVWIAGLVGLAGVAWYFWPSNADAENHPFVPTIGTAPYIPPPLVAFTPMEKYTALRGDYLSLITQRKWQSEADARADAAGIPRYDAAQLWLLLWSANYRNDPDPNVVQIGDVLNLPRLTAFTDDDIAHARAYYLDWRDYSP